MPHHGRKHGRRHGGGHGIGRAIGRALAHGGGHHGGHGHGHHGHGHGGHHHHHVSPGVAIGAAVVGAAALGGGAAYVASRSSQPHSSGGYGGSQPRSSGGYGGQPRASGGYGAARQGGYMGARPVVVVQQPAPQVVYVKQPVAQSGYGGAPVIQQPVSAGAYGGAAPKQPVARGGYGGAVLVKQPVQSGAYGGGGGGGSAAAVQKQPVQPVAKGGYGCAAPVKKQPVAAAGYVSAPAAQQQPVYVPPPAQPVQPVQQPQPVYPQEGPSGAAAAAAVTTHPVQTQPVNPYYTQGAAQQVAQTGYVGGGGPGGAASGGARPPPAYGAAVTTSAAAVSTSAAAVSSSTGPIVYPKISHEHKAPEKVVIVRKTYTEPLPDARPSILGAPTYTTDMAMADAKRLRHAFKGLGSDKKVIADVCGSRSYGQRLMIKEQYVHVAKKERNLLKDLNSETSGEFRKLCMLCFASPGAADAKWMLESMAGHGYKTDLMCEILLTRTNADIAAMKAAWPKIDKGKLEKRVADETSKMFSSGHFKTFMLKVLEGKRPANEPVGMVNEAKVKADAEYLNRMANSGGKEGKSAFITIFTERSWAHLNRLSATFQAISKKYTLASCAKRCLGDSDTGKGIQILIEFTSAPYDYWAKKLLKAMKGVGTDNCLLRRIIISRSEKDLKNIAEVFAQRYGGGKTLKNWIDGETSGPNKSLLNKLCGFDL